MAQLQVSVQAGTLVFLEYFCGSSLWMSCYVGERQQMDSWHKNAGWLFATLEDHEHKKGAKKKPNTVRGLTPEMKMGSNEETISVGEIRLKTHWSQWTAGWLT